MNVLAPVSSIFPETVDELRMFIEVSEQLVKAISKKINLVSKTTPLYKKLIENVQKQGEEVILAQSFLGNVEEKTLSNIEIIKNIENAKKKMEQIIETICFSDYYCLPRPKEIEHEENSEAWMELVNRREEQQRNWNLEKRKQARRIAIAKNPEIMEQVIINARNNGNIPTTRAVIKLINKK